MFVVEIPFRPVVVKVDGANTELLEFAPGFWEVEKTGEGVLGSRGKTLISNPLIQALLNYSDVSVGEQVLFRLVPAKLGNPGKDDEIASITNHLSNVV